MTTIRFETEKCRRCGGTGLHSFNRTDGSVCYGCSGRGVARTENAKQAAEMLKKLAAKLGSIAVAELEPFDVIRVHGRKSGWSVVVAVEDDELNVGRVDVTLEGNRHVNYPGDMTLRRPLTEEERGIYVAAALEMSGVIVED